MNDAPRLAQNLDEARTRAFGECTGRKVQCIAGLTAKIPWRRRADEQSWAFGCLETQGVQALATESWCSMGERPWAAVHFGAWASSQGRYC